MRVALVRKAYVYHGGAERYISTLLRKLVSEGTDVHVFANTWEIDPDIEEKVAFHRVPILPGLSIFQVVSFALLSRWLLSRYKFDLIHSFDKTFYQDIYRAGDGCHKEWLKLRKQVVSSWKRFSMSVNPLHLSLLAIERRLFARGAYKKIIATSKMGKREIMEQYGVLERDIVVIHNGVNHDIFNDNNKAERRCCIRLRHRIPMDHIMILFVGSGFERKGLACLIRALGLLKNHVPCIGGMVLGKGNKRSMKSLARQLGIEERILFLGTRTDVADYYVAADIFAMPTLYEPFGNVYLEAMASGIPVVISSRSGACDLIENGINGLVLDDPLDVEKLSQCILRLTDQEYAARIGEAGKARSYEYSDERNAELTLQLYHEVLTDT